MHAFPPRVFRLAHVDQVSPTKKTASTGGRSSSAVCEEDGDEVEEHPRPKKKNKRSKQDAAPVEKEHGRRRKERDGKSKAKAKVSSSECHASGAHNST